MTENSFVLHGAVAYSQDSQHLFTSSDAYIVCIDGVCRGVFETLPEEFAELELIDEEDKLIIPGMSDLMSLGAAYQIRGMHMDESYQKTIRAVQSEEKMYLNGTLHSELAYDFFSEELYLGTTTRAAVAGCHDAHEDEMLMARLDQAGLVSCMGNVDESRLFKGEYDSDIYVPGKALSEEILEAVRENDDFLVQCPNDELNFPDEFAFSPVRKWMEMGINVGLGSGLGDDLSMLKVMKAAIQVSKLRCRQGKGDEQPLCFEEVFYLATKGGGSYFGPCGSFEEGYQFDAVIIDDNEPLTVKEPSVRDRLERMMYLGNAENITGKYVLGEKLY